MENNGLSNRELMKQKLRSQVVSNSNSVNQGNWNNDDETEQLLKKRKRKKRIILCIIIGILVIGAFALYGYLKKYNYKNYSVAWERSMQAQDAEHSEGAYTEFLSFGTNILKITKDGATYIDINGKDIWTVSYEMSAPIAAINGDYVVIADQQGNKFVVCDKNGSLGTGKTLLPIIKVTISARGVVAALLEDSKANYITMFKKDGSSLDITIKGLLGGSVGYPLDINLSPDGTQLVGSYVYINSGTIKNRVAFHNFSEIGKNISNRLVAGFDEQFNDSMVAKVYFMTDIYSCAFADTGLSFFSSKNVMSPEMIAHVDIPDEIQSIFYSKDYVGVIVKNNSGENPLRMEIYKNNGTKAMSLEFNYNYKGADIDGSHVILYNDESCRIYNMSGNLKFAENFDFSISKVRMGKFPNTVIVTGAQVMKELKLQ